MRTISRTVAAFGVCASLLWLAAPSVAAPPPDVVALPDGFAPEGITVTPGGTAYVGSLADGDVVRIDLHTGAVSGFISGTGSMAVGLATDDWGRLWVAGGDAGVVRVHDLDDGGLVARRDLGGGFVNDVVVTRDAAWLTDSFSAHLFRVPIGADGAIGTAAAVPITGDWQQVAGAFNANGIAATPDGGRLVVVQTTAPEQDGSSALYVVDPDSGVSDRIALRGGIANGDGLVLVGRRLYVVENFSNAIAEIRLDGGLSSGVVLHHISDPRFRIPTTAAKVGARLWTVNARFDTPPGPAVDYDIVAVDR